MVRRAFRDGEKGTSHEWEYFATKVFVVLAIKYQIVDPDPDADRPPAVNCNRVLKGSPFAVLSEKYPRFLKTVADTLSDRLYGDKLKKVRW